MKGLVYKIAHFLQPFQRLLHVHVVTCASDRLVVDKVPTLLGFEFARATHRTHETFYSLDQWFIIKGYNSGTARWARGTVQGQGKECGAYRAYSPLGVHRSPHSPTCSPTLLGAHHSPHSSTCSPTLKLSESHLLGFYGGFNHRHD